MERSPSIWQLPLTDFRNAIEARAMPGCGAAAAVSAGLGLALVLKGLRLSDTRAPGVPRRELIARGDGLRDELARLADDDIAVFENYLSAKKHSHGTPQRAGREIGEMERAIESACRVPLAIARACRDGLVLSVEALPQTAERLQSDTLAGAKLLHAGLGAVLAGVDDNLEGLADPKERRALEGERETLQAEADSWLSRLSA
ncbi:cyclodeaminase/cyclohydrolase family protein [Billgrantia pellis]|uniref:Cyclodeaminase/cyclohydrolase family protein n=1 Tax=Billgrantia pellis TaxID=2606936 RepID=A0A7V7KH45_9GAMM|nr:cyclodeaminase/cyclohydrolase family protein [Halomonas pellis]KAA0010731.1 cyclodeaminase/cyclohydrolase family protein [Halomonas pellis]